MDDKNMFFGIPTYLFASIFVEIIPDIITKDFKKDILKTINLSIYCFRSLLNVSRDKINFAYIVIQLFPYKKYSPSDALNCLKKFYSPVNNFANKFKKICDMYNEFNNKNL